MGSGDDSDNTLVDDNPSRSASEGPANPRGRQRSISLILPPTSAAESISLLANVSS
jgi:hypothetical protein